MWQDVKPITLFLRQDNEDGSYFLLYFYSHDYELVKLKEATHISMSGENILGSFCSLLEIYDASGYSAQFFIERLTKATTQKMIEYYENSNLSIEYFI
jgi:hypothetical protein